MPDFVSINDLSIAFDNGDGDLLTVVDHVNIDIKRGERVGIVGESGSGKTLTSLSLLGLLPSQNASYSSGNIIIRLGEEEIDVTKLELKRLNDIRGNRIAMIFQEPMSSLDPVYRCGYQVDEVYLSHLEKNRVLAKKRTIELFLLVQLEDPERIYYSYPHEISGGQIQRVMIAMALVCEPQLLIADEPTTALDVTIQKEIIALLKDLSDRLNMALLFISHDLALVSQISERVYVMYEGKIVEQGDTKEVFKRPKENYTRALLACRPSLEKRARKLTTVGDLTWLSKEDAKRDENEEVKREWSHENVLIIEHLSKTYFKNSFLGFIKKASTIAVNDVSLSLKKQEILGIVGESGSGKSTLVKCILGIEKAETGKIIFNDLNLTQLSPRQWRPLRKKIQIIFQNPYSSLNPKMKIGNAVSEALEIIKYKGNKHKKVEELFDLVSIPYGFYNRYPFQLSGGQRQRICIARALAMQPEILLCDESVSALDVSVQAQILNLLLELRISQGVSIIFITHDFSVVSYLCDRIIVMQHGRVVETGSPENIIKKPKEEYTKNLINSIPTLL
ncbi:MAG: ABC transporter ATP-binding protein [Saprospiraceae bacterium]